MRQLLLLFTFSISISAYCQQYLDKDFYLVDSISLNTIDESNLVLLDSFLTEYHKAALEEERLEILENIVDDMIDVHLADKYNQYRLKHCYFHMFSKDRSEDELHLYKLGFARGLNALGRYQMDIGNTIKSLDCYYTALELFKEVGHADDFAQTFTNIGTNYFHQNDIQQSKYYLELAYDSLDGTEDMELMSSALNNLAVIHQELGEVESSISYHFKSLNLSKEIGNIPGVAMSYNNIGGIYATLEDSTEAGVNYLEKALKIFKDISAIDWIALTYQKLAIAQLKLKQYEKAEKNSNFSLLYAIDAGQSYPLLRAYKTVYKVKKAMGKGSEALDCYEKYVVLKDSVYSLEIKQSSSQKELEYQYKADKELAQKENEKRLAIEKSKQERQVIFNYWISAFVGLVLIFSIVQLRRNRKIKRQSELIEKQSEERKILLKEIHHRVKNNFQIICSVLRLQAYDEDNPIVDRAFEDAVNRIQSMAEVHEMIYKEEAFSHINPKNYFERLTNSIQHLSYDRTIEYQIESDFEELPMEVMICLGISVNELITNSIKHAFQLSETDPRITISIIRSDDDGVMIYKDNGVGYDSTAVLESFGTELIKTIIEQIQGHLHYKMSESGSEVIIGFTLSN